MHIAKPAIGRRLAGHTFEHLGKIICVRIPDRLSGLLHTDVCAGQQALCLSDPVVCQETDEGLAEVLFEQLAEVRLGIAQLVRDVRYGQFIHIVAADDLPDSLLLAADAACSAGVCAVFILLRLRGACCGQPGGC